MLIKVHFKKIDLLSFCFISCLSSVVATGFPSHDNYHFLLKLLNLAAILSLWQKWERFPTLYSFVFSPLYRCSLLNNQQRRSVSLFVANFFIPFSNIGHCKYMESQGTECSCISQFQVTFGQGMTYAIFFLLRTGHVIAIQPDENFSQDGWRFNQLNICGQLKN